MALYNFTKIQRSRLSQTVLMNSSFTYVWVWSVTGPYKANYLMKDVAKNITVLIFIDNWQIISLWLKEVNQNTKG